MVRGGLKMFCLGAGGHLLIFALKAPKTELMRNGYGRQTTGLHTNFFFYHGIQGLQRRKCFCIGFGKGFAGGFDRA